MLPDLPMHTNTGKNVSRVTWCQMPHTEQRYPQSHHTLACYFPCIQPRSAVSCSFQNKTSLCIVLREVFLKCCPQLKALPWLRTSPCVYRQKQLICWFLAHHSATPCRNAQGCLQKQWTGRRSQVTGSQGQGWANAVHHWVLLSHHPLPTKAF